MTKRFNLFVAGLFAAVAFAWTAAAMDVPRMTKEELTGKVDAGESVIIADVRSGSDWSGSEFKIQGAVRVNDLDAFSANHAKDAEIVLYCA